MNIIFENLTKIFKDRITGKKDIIAVIDFSIEIPNDKLVALLGPSGCGKSTTLNLISGLEEATKGKIYFGNDDVTNEPLENRGIGMVFQNYTFYPFLFYA